MRELEGAPAGFIENSHVKQQAGKTNARSRTLVKELEGARAGFTVYSRMKQQAEKTNARNRTSVWELEGAPAGFNRKFTYEIPRGKNKRT